MYKTLSILSLAVVLSACSNTIVVEEHKKVIKTAVKPYSPTYHFVEFEFDSVSSTEDRD